MWANIIFDDHDPDTARWGCPECGGIVEDSEKPQLLKSGRWKAESGSRGIAGFHISELYSPWRTWADVVHDFLEAKRASKTGDHSLMQVWVNTSLGETWEQVGVTVDPMGLYERREDWKHVPEGVTCLTIGADCQNNRVEWEVVGWGMGEESWSIDYQVRFGDLTKADFWAGIARDMKRTYKREDGHIFDVKLVCIDSGGHFTDEVYEFSRVHGHRFFIPIKGSSIKGKPIADFPRKLNKKRVMLTMVGGDVAKEVIYSRLEIQDKGAGYCHFPVERNTDYFQQLTAEKKIMRYVKGHPTYDWVLPSGQANEALDCRVYAFAAVRILQQYFGINLSIPLVPRETSKEPPKTPRSVHFGRQTPSGFTRR